MDSSQSVTEGSFDANRDSNQDQDNNMSSMSKESENGVQTKRIKLELDPLQMGNILENIFSYLDVDSIKNARQVNSLWSIEGAKTLMTKCYLQIPPNIETEVWNPNEMSEFELSGFPVFLSLKASDRSMIPSITIGTIADFDILNSLGVLGPQVKAVKLKYLDFEANLLYKLLDPQILPNLTYLKFEGPICYSNVMDVLQNMMSKEEKAETKLTISNMNLYICDFEDIEKLSNCTNIMIEKIEFNIQPALYNRVANLEARLYNIMSKLLSTNQNTLNSLTVNNCHLFLSLLEFPCMTRLTCLRLGFYPANISQMACCKFSPSFRFLEKISNLQEVSIQFGTSHWNVDDSMFLQSLFQDAGAASSVKRVKCLRGYKNVDAKFLLKLFPNVEDLQTCVNPNCSSWFDSLWTLGTKIRKLYLYFDLDQNFDLDSIFTGCTLRVVQKIRNSPNLDHYTMDELKELRGPSILNLNDLEHLTIDLEFNGHRVLPKRMLAVAEKFAFRLLPKNPKISIHIERKYCGHDCRYNGNSDVLAALAEVCQRSNVRVEEDRPFDLFPYGFY